MIERMYKIKTVSGNVVLTTREAQKLYEELREIFEDEVIKSECMCDPVACVPFAGTTFDDIPF